MPDDRIDPEEFRKLRKRLGIQGEPPRGFQRPTERELATILGGLPELARVTGRPAPKCKDQGCSEEEWELPATVLNIFWSDVFPRHCARVWSGKAPPWPALEEDLWCLVIDDLENWLDETRSEFRERVGIVYEYISGNLKRPLFRYMGTGGFDFVLSDTGVDVFAPPTPPEEEVDFQAYMARLYTFRSTGRLPIGLPEFLAPGVPTAPTSLRPGTQMDAMTGASQIEYPEDDWDTVARWLGYEESSDPRFEALIVEDPARADYVPLSIGCVACALADQRKWQVTGAVYRAIMEALPRMVADIWLAMTQGDPSGGAYGKVWDDPTDAGLREQVELRLETHLPPTVRMGSFHGPDIYAPRGDGDVHISSDGLEFPAVGCHAPTRDGMLEAIWKGNAGNPVFTSSSAST